MQMHGHARTVSACLPDMPRYLVPILEALQQKGVQSDPFSEYHVNRLLPEAFNYSLTIIQFLPLPYFGHGKLQGMHDTLGCWCIAVMRPRGRSQGKKNKNLRDLETQLDLESLD